MQASPGAGLPPVHPIDHGYSWMVALGAFVMNFFVTGGMRSTGLLFIEIIELFNADRGMTSVTLGLTAFGYALFAAIGNAIGAMSTMRRAAMIGAVFIFFGMLFTAISSNLFGVIMSLGLLSGIGYGFVYGPSMVLVGQYFDKRRSLATGLAAAGGSVGTLVLPLLLNYTLTKYGFRGAMLIYAGITLHAVPAAMLLRPVSFYDVLRRKQQTEALMANVAPPSNNGRAKQQQQEPQQRSRDHVDRAARYKLVGSRLYPAISEISLYDSEELQAEAEKEAAAARTGPGQVPAGSSPTATAAAAGPPPRPTLGLAVRMFGRRMFDRDLLRSSAFIVFVLGVTFGHAGFVDACFFVPPYAVERWHSKKLATLLLTILGICDLAGRIVGGWFADLGIVRRPLIIAFSFVVVGITTVVITFFRSFVVMAIGTVVLGSLGGCYLALIVVVVADLGGIAKLPSGVGLTSLSMGIVMLPLPPILGSLQKVTGSFAIAIQLSGILVLLGGVLLYAIPKMQRKDARRAEQKQKQQQQPETGDSTAAADPIITVMSVSEQSAPESRC